MTRREKFLIVAFGVQLLITTFYGFSNARLLADMKASTAVMQKADQQLSDDAKEMAAAQKQLRDDGAFLDKVDAAIASCTPLDRTTTSVLGVTLTDGAGNVLAAK